MQDATSKMLQFISSYLPKVAMPSIIICDHQIEGTKYLASHGAKFVLRFLKPRFGITAITNSIVLKKYTLPGFVDVGTDSPNISGRCGLCIGGDDVEVMMARIPWEPNYSKLGKQNMEKLLTILETSSGAPGPASPQSGSSVDSANAMEQLTTDTSDKMETSSKEGRGLSKPTPQLQPVLSGSSCLGHALAELFDLLVKLSIESPRRQRAFATALSLIKLLASGLLWEPPAKFRLTFFICSVGFTTPKLFEEKKLPYHLMLIKFISSRGQQVFFRTFNWAISLANIVQQECGLEHPDIPDGTEVFLDAWLIKMVNPKPSGNFKTFDWLQYLIKTHKLAFKMLFVGWPISRGGPRGCQRLRTELQEGKVSRSPREADKERHSI